MTYRIKRGWALLSVGAFVACGNDLSPRELIDPVSTRDDDSGAGDGDADVDLSPWSRDGGSRDANPPRDGSSDATTDRDASDAPPADSSPDAPLDATLSCDRVDLGSSLGESLATGTTAGAGNHLNPSCNGGGEDALFQWEAPYASTFTFDTSGSFFDTVLSVIAGECDGAELGCNDDYTGVDSRVAVSLADHEKVTILIDGYGGSTGDFVLNIFEATTSEAGLCHDDLDNDRDGTTDCSDWECEGVSGCSETVCNDGIDEDSDGETDCEDYDCYYEDVCTETLCADGVDDDSDGETDCEDYDCYYDDACTETSCADGVDDDSDGETDCADYDCYYDDACTETVCTDGVDDDSDGDTDCEDYDCYYEPACDETGHCHDGIDNDADGSIDCADWECEYEPECTETMCADGLDDDGDGETDCADYDCYGELACTEMSCDDGVDGDDDGLIDCEDYDCNGDHACEERDCDDGLDADADGLLDCDDPDCRSYPTCDEAMCADGVDDDADGEVDCADSECRCVSACVSGVCEMADLGSTVGAMVHTGTTASGCAVRSGGCGGSSSRDVSLRWTAPAAGVFTFDTEGSTFDTVLYIKEGDCSGAELACNDEAIGHQSRVSTTLGVGDTVIIVVDGYGGDAGRYVLNIAGD